MKKLICILLILAAIVQPGCAAPTTSLTKETPVPTEKLMSTREYYKDTVHYRYDQYDKNGTIWVYTYINYAFIRKETAKVSIVRQKKDGEEITLKYTVTDTYFMREEFHDDVLVQTIDSNTPHRPGHAPFVPD